MVDLLCHRSFFNFKGNTLKVLVYNNNRIHICTNKKIISCEQVESDNISSSIKDDTDNKGSSEVSSCKKSESKGSDLDTNLESKGSDTAVGDDKAYPDNIYIYIHIYIYT